MFKVVDIRSREMLAENASARDTIQVLNGVRSIIDVNVYVWMPATEKWRLLTFDEQRLLWSRREPAPTHGLNRCSSLRRRENLGSGVRLRRRPAVG